MALLHQSGEATPETTAPEEPEPYEGEPIDGSFRR